MSLARSLSLLPLLASLCLSATIFVPDDHATIQGAIDASTHGDTIIVRPGTYVENINFLGKAVAVRSESGPDVTVIDGGSPIDPHYGCVVAFESGEGGDSVLEGFSLVNGTGFDRWLTYYTVGGGIYCVNSSPSIIANIISSCRAFSDGGGILCRDGAAVVEGSRIQANESSNGDGGGVSYLNSSGRIRGNQIVGNKSLSGGGLCLVESSVGVERNTISNNSSDSGAGVECRRCDAIAIEGNVILENIGGYGGGVFCSECTGAITSNVIVYNAGSVAGGLYLVDSDVTAESNVISGNSARTGGGMMLMDSYAESCDCVVVNSLICRNTAFFVGGGIASGCDFSEPKIVNCTVSENTAGYMCGGIDNAFGKLALKNCIVWSNYAPSYPEMVCYFAEHSDVKGGCPGPGNIDADPLFVAAWADDFHLTYDSPCRNAGLDSSGVFPHDFEGDARRFQGKVDIGADEFYYHLYCPTGGEVAPGSYVQVNAIGPPGLDPLILAFGSGVQDPPQPTPYGDLYLRLPWTWCQNFGKMPDSGVETIFGLVPASWQPGDEKPFQALIGPLGNPFTRLTNLMVLQVE